MSIRQKDKPSTLKQQRDELAAALMPFALLLQPHNDKGADYLPVFAINDAAITLGDLRRANAALTRATLRQRR